MPSAGARTGVPNAAAMSIPRCPAEKGVAGGTNPRTTWPSIGHVHEPTGGDVEASAGAAISVQPTAATTAPANARVLIGARTILPGHPEVLDRTLADFHARVSDPDHTDRGILRSPESP